ncbi:phosphoserine phosphatase SerB [Corallincola platygyrae]|uniref:Phosphoserine phosphatase n=1 Tax=Corallincola platygyrae TaxID=1193278 RepID=A0ABW4XQR8_9GAMM
MKLVTFSLVPAALAWESREALGKLLNELRQGQSMLQDVALTDDGATLGIATETMDKLTKALEAYPVAEKEQVTHIPRLGSRLVVWGEGLHLKGLSLVLDFLKQHDIPVNGIRKIDALEDADALGAVVVDLANAEYPDRATLATVGQSLGLDLNLLSQSAPVIDQPGLLLMDMDSTAIQIECIDEIAKLAGVGEQVAEVTELAMQGKLDFAESLRGRVATLEGSSESILADVAGSIPLTPGLEPLLKVLKDKGWKAAIVSGGFTYFTGKLERELGLDFTRANNLEIVDGTLTGKVQGDIVDAKVKAVTLNELQAKFGIADSQTVAAGDGANDLLMMDEAAMGVAFYAKPVVQAKAATGINYGGLEGVYYLLASD